MCYTQNKAQSFWTPQNVLSVGSTFSIYIKSPSGAHLSFCYWGDLGWGQKDEVIRGLDLSVASTDLWQWVEGGAIQTKVCKNSGTSTWLDTCECLESDTPQFQADRSLCAWDPSRPHPMWLFISIFYTSLYDELVNISKCFSSVR